MAKVTYKREWGGTGAGNRTLERPNGKFCLSMSSHKKTKFLNTHLLTPWFTKHSWPQIVCNAFIDTFIYVSISYILVVSSLLSFE